MARRARLPVRRELSLVLAAVAVVAATVAGAAVRLLITRDLSVNEIQGVDASRQPFTALIHGLVHHGIRPPLHPVLEWLVVRGLGPSDLDVRVPALVAGILLVPAAAWLAGELFDRRTAVFAAALAAPAPILVWYSQEASGYALVALFGTLAVLGAARAVRRGRPIDWALHAVAAALCVWADWSGILIVVGTELVFGAAALRRRSSPQALRPFLAGWGLNSLALASQLVPLGLLAAHQFATSGGLAGVTDVGAGGVSFYTGVSNVSWGLFGFHPGTVTSVLSAVWPLVMLASLVIIGRGVSRQVGLLMVCGLVPVLGVLVLGIVAPHGFDVRYMIAAVPMFVVFLAHAASSWPRGRAGRLLTLAGILLVLSIALVDQQIDGQNPRRYDYRTALAAARAEARPGSAVFYAPSNLRAAVARYTPGLSAAPLTPHLPTRAQARRVVLVVSFDGQPGLLPLLNRELGALRATRHLLSHRNYPGAQVWSYR